MLFNFEYTAILIIGMFNNFNASIGLVKEVLYKEQLKQVILNLMQFKKVAIKIYGTKKMKT